MQAELINPGEIPELKDCRSLMLISPENCYDELKEGLESLKVPYFGGVFPGVIYGDKKYENKVVAVRFSEKVRIFRDSEMPKDVKGTLFVFADGLCDKVEDILENAFVNYGYGVDYIGGGAGSLSFERIECLFDSKGFFKDGCLFANVKQEAEISVRHGWSPTEKTFIATKTDGRGIVQLDWRQAFDVYGDALADYGKHLDEENFFDIAKAYPFGLTRVEGEYIVRDPLFARDGKIVCAGRVPENSLLTLMRGSKKRLVDAARKCGEDISAEKVFVADCISRVLYLGGYFKRELKAINKDCFGPLTIGEVVSSGTFIEFYNKTLVLGGMYG